MKERQARHSKRDGESHRIYRERSQRMSGMRKTKEQKRGRERRERGAHGTLGPPDLSPQRAKSGLMERN